MTDELKERVERCDRCRFWVKEEEQEAPHPDDFVGRCHRRAPWPFASEWWYEVLHRLSWIADRKADDTIDNTWEEATDHGSTYWPLTEGADWCGEFEPSA